MNLMTYITPLLVTCLFTAGAEAAPAGEVPRREAIPAAYKWHLDDIYPDEQAWQIDYDLVKQAIPQFARFQSHVMDSSQSLADVLALRDDVGQRLGKLFGYARMHRDEDTANTKYQAMTDQVEALASAAGAAAAFIEPEILAAPPEKLLAYRDEEPRLAIYKHNFDDLLRQRAHVLSAPEEALLAQVAEPLGAAENIYNMLSHADMKFPTVKDGKNQPVELSEGRYKSLIMDPDRKVRQEAFTALHGTYRTYRNTFATALGAEVKKNVFYARARRYHSSLEAALESDNVPVDVYDNLIRTVRQNLAPLHRYVALKKKLLQLPEMHMYDLYVPVVTGQDITMPYDAALDTVRQALAPMGEEYGANLARALHSGWIDVYENRGKQSGAYSWGVYGVHPYVLLNYNNRLDDVFTIAHEMGHAMHSFYSQQAQPYPTSSYTTFCAEVASTTNEVLLHDYLLAHTTDRAKKMYLLHQYLEGIRATVYRQTLFAEFERAIHARVEQNQPLTADELDALWHKLNEEYYGPDIVVDKDIDVEWARIPHFYMYFYVYQYVTGYAAATALADKIQHEGAPAQTRYIEFLKSGGSDYSLNLLRRAGVDMATPEPIETTLRKFSKLVDELAALAAQ